MFLVCGEALLDVFAGASTLDGLMLDARIGGSPLNVAMGLARLGQPVSFLGALSDGFLGDRLMQALRDEGIATDCLQRVAAPATLSLVGLDARGVPSYAFYGSGAADRQLSSASLARLPADVRAVHVGSYAMVVLPVASTQRAVIERLHASALVAYDPNVRLNVEPDIARWRDALHWMLPRTHVLKLSEEDLALLYPQQDMAALAQGWLAQGVRLVVVTRGADGALAWAAQQMFSVAPVPTQVVDTVGAGDTFQAALLVALSERGLLSVAALAQAGRASLAGALDFAARAAAITCSRRGAQLPYRQELPAHSAQRQPHPGARPAAAQRLRPQRRSARPAETP